MHSYEADDSRLCTYLVLFNRTNGRTPQSYQYNPVNSGVQMEKCGDPDASPLPSLIFPGSIRVILRRRLRHRRIPYELFPAHWRKRAAGV